MLGSSRVGQWLQLVYVALAQVESSLHGICRHGQSRPGMHIQETSFTLFCVQKVSLLLPFVAMDG